MPHILVGTQLYQQGIFPLVHRIRRPVRTVIDELFEEFLVSSLEFVSLINNYISYIDSNYFNATDYIYNDIFIDKEFIRNRYDAYKKRAIFSRVDKIADDIIEKIEEATQGKFPDIIIGGPPCQAYSIHGRATDKDSMNNDYRNTIKKECFIRK